jgi:large subunit ribosomal protein L31e
MADNKLQTAEKEVKKLDEFKDSEENKKAIAEAEGSINKKGKSNDKKKAAKKKEVVEIEREYIVPLRRGFLNVPKYKRAKKAVKILKEFMARHMGVRDGDLNKIKIDRYLNNEIWFRGIKKPMGKVRVFAKKIDGIVYVELAELPDVVRFAKAREEKRKTKVEKVKPKKVEKEKEEKTEEEKTEEVEDKKAETEREAKIEKAAVKELKHTAKAMTGKQEKQLIRRKAMKR